ncbi:MAG: hypothetical protein ACI883_000962, partial [Candidatus Azotimanducaceae bacterium]
MLTNLLRAEADPMLGKLAISLLILTHALQHHLHILTALQK